MAWVPLTLEGDFRRSRLATAAQITSATTIMQTLATSSILLNRRSFILRTPELLFRYYLVRFPLINCRKGDNLTQRILKLNRGGGCSRFVFFGQLLKQGCFETSASLRGIQVGMVGCYHKLIEYIKREVILQRYHCCRQATQAAKHGIKVLAG